MSTAIVMPNMTVNGSSRLFGTDLSNVLKGDSKNALIRHDLIQKKLKIPVRKAECERKYPKRALFINNEPQQGKEEIVNAQLEEFPPQIEKSLEQMVQKLIADDDSPAIAKSVLKYDREFMLKFSDLKVKPAGMMLIPEITRKPGTDNPIPTYKVWLPKPQTEIKVKKAPKPKEDDTHRLQQREKQLEFGKNTLGYKNYRELVPKKKRTRDEPQTPDKYQKCSKRSWDGQIRKWRRLLHKYDPTGKYEDEDCDIGIEINEEEIEMEVVDVLQDLNLKTSDKVLAVDTDNAPMLSV